MGQVTALKLALIAYVLAKHGLKVMAKASSGLAIFSVVWQITKAIIRMYNQGCNAQTIAKSLKEIIGEFIPVDAVVEIIDILKSGDVSNISYKQQSSTYVQSAQQFLASVSYQDTLYEMGGNQQAVYV